MKSSFARLGSQGPESDSSVSDVKLASSSIGKSASSVTRVRSIDRACRQCGSTFVSRMRWVTASPCWFRLQTQLAPGSFETANKRFETDVVEHSRSTCGRYETTRATIESATLQEKPK